MGSVKTQNLQKQLNNVNTTEWSPVQSIIMQVIHKSHDCKAGVSFVNHDYDNQQKVLLQIDQNYDKT